MWVLVAARVTVGMDMQYREAASTIVCTVVFPVFDCGCVPYVSIDRISPVFSS